MQRAREPHSRPPFGYSSAGSPADRTPIVRRYRPRPYLRADPHLGRTDIDSAVLPNEQGFVVADDAILPDTDEVGLVSCDLEVDFRVTHPVAILFAIVGDGH
jgi:hypothetical protein